MKIKILSFFVLMAALSMPLSAQRLDKLRKGNEYYIKKQYTEAIAEYETLMSSAAGANIMGVDARLNLADSYRQTNQPLKAEHLYKEILDIAIEDRPEVLLQYGEILMGVGKYQEAKDNFNRYAQLRGEDPRSAELIAQCEAIQAIRPIYYDVTLEPQEVLNTAQSEEFGLSYYGNGIVFASNQILRTTDEWKGIGTVDMYYSEMSPDGNLLSPRLLSKSLNTTGQHEGPATFSRDGKTIYFAKSVKPSINAPEGTVSIQIFTATNDNGKWSKPEILPFNIPDLIFTHPCLSADGTQLFFVSNMANGGHGGLDIWVSTWRGDRWAAPKNLGASINTTKDEAFPFLHPDGTLYFASKGHGNYGGYDIFRAFPVGNGFDFQKPENMGQPINTAFDDTYFLLSDNQTEGFLSSNRAGSDDIYRFILEGETPKELPANIFPRVAAIFNDSADIEGLVIESDLPKIKPNINIGAETQLDSLLEQGIAEVAPTEAPYIAPLDDEDNTNPNKVPKANADVVRVDSHEQQTTPSLRPKNTIENEAFDNNNAIVNDGTTITTINTPAQETKKEADLMVEIHIVDATSKSPLDNSSIILKNAFTGKEEKVVVENGAAILKLSPDQKYEVIANCEGYYGGKLPITTMGAYETQTASAVFPLMPKS